MSFSFRQFLCQCPQYAHGAKLLMLALCLSATAAVAKTPLEKELKVQNYQLPRLIYYRDMKKVAMDLQVIGIKEILIELDVTFYDADDDSSAYVKTKDLLTLCGEDCAADSDWGAFLQEFAVQIYGR